MVKNKKPKVAILALTSCEGCQFAILDKSEKFLELTKKIDLTEMRLLKEYDYQVKPGETVCDNIDKADYFDIVFIEGSPITKENFEMLKKVRKKSKILVALGACAAIGGIYHLKNYHDKKKLLKYIYEKCDKIDNPDIQPIDEIVKVDYYIPTCPIVADEFFQCVYDLLAGKKFKIDQKTVCYECQINENECLLQKGLPCLGPITLGGCNSVCLNSKQACYGCRGLNEDPQIDNYLKELEKHRSNYEIQKVLECFGIKDKIDEYKNFKK